MRQVRRGDGRLSKAVPIQPEGDKMVAKDLGIDKIDSVSWDASKIRFVSLEFNNIEKLGDLGQFKNLVGVDLSNNNVDHL